MCAIFIVCGCWLQPERSGCTHPINELKLQMFCVCVCLRADERARARTRVSYFSLFWCWSIIILVFFALVFLTNCGKILQFSSAGTNPAYWWCDLKCLCQLHDTRTKKKSEWHALSISAQTRARTPFQKAPVPRFFSRDFSVLSKKNTNCQCFTDKRLLAS